MSADKLGQGSYGTVIRKNGVAIKKFRDLSYLIQEYTALKYLENCKYIVHARKSDYKKMELHMKLYDMSLRTWFKKKYNRNSGEKVDKIIHDILRGLIEIHDRGLAHGDLKLGNILIREEPLKAVLGDCGFVSIAKYAKVERTAEAYRDCSISHSWKHDIFSLGICLVELWSKRRIGYYTTYEELYQNVNHLIRNTEKRNLIMTLISEDKERRPTARDILYKLYGKVPRIYERINPLIIVGKKFESGYKHEIEKLSTFVKEQAEVFRLNRSKKGFGALLMYFNNNEHSEIRKYKLYGCAYLMIISSVFSRKNKFSMDDALTLVENDYSTSDFYEVLESLLNDTFFVKHLFIL